MKYPTVWRISMEKLALGKIGAWYAKGWPLLA